LSGRKQAAEIWSPYELYLIKNPVILRVHIETARKWLLHSQGCHTINIDQAKFWIWMESVCKEEMMEFLGDVRKREEKKETKQKIQQKLTQKVKQGEGIAEKCDEEKKKAMLTARSVCHVQSHGPIDQSVNVAVSQLRNLMMGPIGVVDHTCHLACKSLEYQLGTATKSLQSMRSINETNLQKVVQMESHFFDQHEKHTSFCKAPIFTKNNKATQL